MAVSIFTIIVVRAQETPTTPKEAVDMLIARRMEEQHIPGLALAVIQNETVQLLRGYGVASLEAQTPITQHTLFESASMGKQFTAAAVALLVLSLGEQRVASADDLNAQEANALETLRKVLIGIREETLTQDIFTSELQTIYADIMGLSGDLQAIGEPTSITLIESYMENGLDVYKFRVMFGSVGLDILMARNEAGLIANFELGM